MAVHLLLQRPRRRGGARPGPQGGAREPHPQRPATLRHLGAVSITAAMLVLVYAISQAPQAAGRPPRPSPCSPSPWPCSPGSSSSRRRPRPPPAPPALPPAQCRWIERGRLPARDEFYTFVFLGTLYMQQVLGFSALATGAAWMTASVTSLACAGLSQRIVTRISASPSWPSAWRSSEPGCCGQPGPGTGTSGMTWPGRSSSPASALRSPSSRSPSARSPGLPSATRESPRPAQHLAESRWGDRRGPRLVHRGLALPHAGPPRLRNRCRAHRRVPMGTVGVRSDRLVAIPVAFVLIRRS